MCYKINSRRKYVELKLKRKANGDFTDEEDEDGVLNEKKPKTLENMEEMIMLKAANRVKTYKSKSAYDESVSNQMLVGIPEVDLGIE